MFLVPCEISVVFISSNIFWIKFSFLRYILLLSSNLTLNMHLNIVFVVFHLLLDLLDVYVAMFQIFYQPVKLFFSLFHIRQKVQENLRWPLKRWWKVV